MHGACGKAYLTSKNGIYFQGIILTLSLLAHTNHTAPRRHIIVGIAQDIRAALRLEAEISKGVPPLPLLLPSLSCELDAEAVALEDVKELTAFAVFDPKPDNCDCVRVAAELRVGSAT